MIGKAIYHCIPHPIHKILLLFGTFGKYSIHLPRLHSAVLGHGNYWPKWYIGYVYFAYQSLHSCTSFRFFILRCISVFPLGLTLVIMFLVFPGMIEPLLCARSIWIVWTFVSFIPSSSLTNVFRVSSILHH